MNGLVAFYMHDLSGGGVERMRLALIAELRARGVRAVLVVGRIAGALAAGLPEDLDVVSLDRQGTLGSVLPLARVLRRLRPAVLVASLDHNNVTALLAGRLAPRTRVVICQHNALSAELATGWRYRAIPWLYWALQHWADGIVAVSAGVADDLARTAGIDRARVTAIYNPVVATGVRPPAAPPHRWFDDGGPPVFVFAGRLTRQKDPVLTLRALAALGGPARARLIMLGEGPLRGELEVEAARLGLAEAVAFVSFQADPLPWIANAACLVSTSRYEGLGNVLIEALACGTPVVATDCPHGPAEILDDDAYGTLVPVGDASALAAAMAATLVAPPDPARLRARSACFSAASCADAHLALFAGLLGDGDADSRRSVLTGQASRTVPPAEGAVALPTRKRVFDLTLSRLGAEAVVERLIGEPALQAVQLVATPNIDHVRLLRRAAFREAYASACLTCVDGLPVLLYARLRGLRLAGRVTGCELFARLADHPGLASRRLTFVVESPATRTAVLAWALRRGLEEVCVVTAPPGLADDATGQEALACTIAGARPDILVMTLGAPVSEVFVHRNRHLLAPCWALCVGQAVRVHLGLTSRAPARWQKAGLEWFWRIRQEPRRLAGRYVRAAAWFPVAVIGDLLNWSDR